MTRIILSIYDYFNTHRLRLWLLLTAVTLAMLALVAHITLKEDITDFLPFTGHDRQAMRIAQNASGGNRIIAIIGMQKGAKADADKIAAAADDFHSRLVKGGIDDKRITWQADIGRYEALSQFVYSNIPYFLTPSDYARMERQLSDKGFIDRQLGKDLQLLSLPSAGMMGGNIAQDPLGLFASVTERMAAHGRQAGYELYDGCIFTPDMQHALVIIDSQYGANESAKNGILVSKIGTFAAQTRHFCKGINIRLTGGPVIAVGNASQIKTDSLLSVAVALTFILLLLWLTFRSIRNIALVALAVAWGWLFALGGLAAVHSNVSVIVIGISSVIIGIAVNYPLHLIAHTTHTPNMRHALKEISMPLLVGNITTIGAFLTLVPLSSVALRDLGVFASLLLLGTIAFVLIFLPHLVHRTARHSTPLLDKIAGKEVQSKRWMMPLAVVATLVLGFFSLRTGYDTDLKHLNYMTDEQKADLLMLEKIAPSASAGHTVYVVSRGKTLNGALAANAPLAEKLWQLKQQKVVSEVKSCAPMLCSQAEQAQRLARWRAFTAQYKARLTAALRQKGAAYGFADDSFGDFFAILNGSYPPRGEAYFNTLRQQAYADCVVYDPSSADYCVVSTLTVPTGNMAKVSRQLDRVANDAYHYHFETSELNKSMASDIAQNFNYIGYACAAIVFIFLWLSMGNIELAALSFLPMAVSWVWILGLMGLLGADFNLVNIILATFIFGQGDDYTIFMTEGCQYEYAYGKKMLTSYKSSILVSALIMFLGIGSLILARHPALRSLAEVTIIGMFSVVLMAWVLPPFIFRRLVSKKGTLRRRPLTLKSILRPRRYPEKMTAGLPVDAYKGYVSDAYHYCGIEVTGSVRKALANYRGTDCHKGEALSAPAGNYGALALLLALQHPEAQIVAHVGNADDEAVCLHVACRIASNIKMCKDKAPEAYNNNRKNDERRNKSNA